MQIFYFFLCWFFSIQIYFEIFPEWKKILDNTGVLIIGCLAWGMVFVAWYICKVTFDSATVCQCYWNFCLRSVCYKNL